MQSLFSWKAWPLVRITLYVSNHVLSGRKLLAKCQDIHVDVVHNFSKSTAAVMDMSTDVVS